MKFHHTKYFPDSSFPQEDKELKRGSETDRSGSDVTEISRDEVIRQIKTCYDPEIPVDVWELGLIYELTVVMNNVYVRMTLTSPSCPAAGTLPGDVGNKIKNIPGVKDVTVELVWDPPYSTSMMSEEAKLELGFM